MCNQMFQYALATHLNNKGIKTYVVETEEDGGRKAILHNYFDLKNYNTEFAQNLIKAYYYILSNEKNHILQTIIGILHIFGYRYFYEENLNFNKEVLKMNNAMMIGYFQTEKYFNDKKTKNHLKKVFVLKDEYITPKYLDIQRKIINTNSVAIHIRRTDYLQAKNAIIHNICTEKYYERAISYIKENVSDPTFYVFSDDKEYIKEKYGNLDNFVVIDEKYELQDIQEFFLMSSCKHFIIANSTYSWWSSWLGEKEDSIILAPEVWNRKRDQSDIYTDRMIKIEI